MDYCHPVAAGFPDDAKAVGTYQFVDWLSQAENSNGERIDGRET
jgi:hypothetical protein